MSRLRTLELAAIILLIGFSVLPLAHAQIRQGYAPDYFGAFLEYETFGDDPGRYLVYEVTGWVEGYTDTVNITRRMNLAHPGDMDLLYVSLPGWSILYYSGDDSGDDLYPPLWQNTTGWIDEGIILLPTGSQYYDLIDDVEISTSAGPFICWRLEYAFNLTTTAGFLRVFYDSETGVLVSFYNQTYTTDTIPYGVIENGYEITTLAFPPSITDPPVTDSVLTDTILIFGIVTEGLIVLVVIHRIRSKKDMAVTI